MKAELAGLLKKDSISSLKIKRALDKSSPSVLQYMSSSLIKTDDLTRATSPSRRRKKPNENLVKSEALSANQTFATAMKRRHNVRGLNAIQDEFSKLPDSDFQFASRSLAKKEIGASPGHNPQKGRLETDIDADK